MNISYFSPSLKGFSIYVKEYDTATIVYDERSGDVHRINQLSGLLLQQLIDTPHTSSQLANYLRETFDIDETFDDILSNVEACLEHLKELELVEATKSIPQ